MNICVAGTGYVGLVTGAVFADLGNEVVCVDNDAAKVAELQAGRMPIYEPGLEEMVGRNNADGRLTFTTDLTGTVRRSVIVFMTVGTPPKSDGQADLTAVEDVARGIAQAMERYTVVVNKSTVPVGTGDFVREVIERHQAAPVPFDVVSNPEFLREGSAIEDTLRPDRIVIGAPTQQVAMTLLELYAPLERPMIITDVPSAEMIKYASNAFLVTKISFANAIANICELAGADVNRERPAQLLAKIEKVLSPLDDKVIAVLGLAFKPNTDDMREAKSIEVVCRLVELGATVRVYDPVAMPNA